MFFYFLNAASFIAVYTAWTDEANAAITDELGNAIEFKSRA